MSDELISSGKKYGRDLTVDTLKVANKEPVRELIILTPQDAVGKRGGQYLFPFSYRVNNVGFMGAKDFENIAYFIYADDPNHDKVLTRHSGVSMGPNDSKVLQAQVEMEPAEGKIRVRIDALSRIQEDDETNNEIFTKVVFKGFQPHAPQEANIHIELLRIANKTPKQGRIQLTPKEAKDKKENRHAFPVEFVLRNYGTKPATGFDNIFLLDGKSFFRQKNLSLAPGESKVIQSLVYFPIHNGAFSVHADAEGKYPKGPGCKQSVDTQLGFQGFTGR